MPIPAYQSILAELAHVRESASAEPNIRISIRFFKFLLQVALESLPFDESAYLDGNPDVREAVASGYFGSGRDHFVAHGYFEGRVLGTCEIDEAWYTSFYADVAAAIHAGAYSSASDHYVRAGVFEWRLPTSSAFDDIDRWKVALLGLEPGTPPSGPDLLTELPVELAPPAVSETATTDAALATVSPQTEPTTAPNRTSPARAVETAFATPIG